MQSYQRPKTLYRYDAPDQLERALREGEFRLRPADGCLVLSFCTKWQPERFDAFAGIESCLVIHNTELFGERLHRAVQRVLPDWMGIDGIVEYGTRSPLGALFSKPAGERKEKEWQFAWRSVQAQSTSPIIVKIGNIEQFAEIKGADAHVN
ncbi:MAG TPA: hypothetical protein VIT92_09395 [Burkholderiaceae bacterium]